MASPAKQRPRLRSALTVVIESIGAVVQLLLVFIGVWYLITDDGEAAENLRLLVWSVIATVYLASTVIWLNIDLRFHDEDHPLLKRASASTVVRVFSTVVTFTSSLVGLTAAADLILTRAVSGRIAVYELIAVWAMLASWALFHWGFARIYYSRYHRDEAERPLRFVATTHPRLIDFVYFSYTNGTSFAPSDVSVATSRMRWTVVWHTTFSFFFNALIIVLTMNTISGGFGGL
ncbi:MAG: DUF1345 domain-containing protein [Leucobacter sp.]|jgi:uncharacterized membrane protein|nr:DUF1345 domain-containing protein [Leucobacter sp.]